MMTDGQFMKKEYKHLSFGEKLAVWAIPIAVIAILIIATLFLFVFKQECKGIDKEFAYCYVHPATRWGILGLILFYSGGLYLSGIIPYALIFFFNVEDDSSKLLAGKWIAAICLLCFFLIYV